ncbi:hypothetical protein B0H66DRAFT_608748 [Apodospora peruviana]|uniref:Uncharacterized protein n=1 Tax=Apodospora peruviana TaxID=516989 RepID=A0AAE0LYK2_9PEZI|nr:hypothetical protein B0H66DRAFT_608748 [Apodospora peruviana]
MATHLEGQPPASSALHDGMLYHRVNSGPTAIAPIDDFGFQEGDRCKDERCQYIQFFTHTILLLHERQIHAHGEKTYLCTYDERQYYFIAQPLPAAGLLQLTRGLENDLFIFKDGYVLKSKVTGIFIESVDWNENEIRKFWKDELAPLGSIADPAKVEEVSLSAVYQFLRNGNCAEEVANIQQRMGEVKELADKEMERVNQCDEDYRQRLRLGMKKLEGLLP